MENDIIMLSIEQRQRLENFTKTGVRSVRLVKRANVILALDRSNKKDHLRINRICEQCNISRQGLNDIREDFLNAESIDAFLTRKKRKTPPVAPKVTGEVEAHIIAIACSEKPEGRARWTMQLIADKCVELNYVDSLSEISVRRTLKKRNISLT
jgi:hypothetical protein